MANVGNSLSWALALPGIQFLGILNASACDGLLRFLTLPFVVDRQHLIGRKGQLHTHLSLKAGRQNGELKHGE